MADSMSTSGNLSLQGSMMHVPDDPTGESDDDKRLWIGNLDSNMTEFAILKLVQKFGSIRKMDFIYHKTGPEKGTSKGYCFVSFHEWKTAEKARKVMDGKLIQGRPMFVKWARSSSERDEYLKVPAKATCGPIDAAGATSSLATASLSSASTTKGSVKSSQFSSRQTEPSFGMSNTQLEAASTTAKIQAIEAKLQFMEQTQKDFSVNAAIKAPPGFVPVPTIHNSRRSDLGGGRPSSRGGPYRRAPQTSRPRQRRR